MTKSILNYKSNILRLELSATSKLGAIASTFLLALYLSALYSIKCDMHYTLIFSGILFLTFVVRSIHSQQDKISNQLWLKQFTGLILLNSVGWFLLIASTIYQNIEHSQVVTISFIVIAGLVASGAYSLSISRRDFFIFQTGVLSVIVFSISLSADNTMYRLFSTLMVVLFFTFLVIQRKNHEKNWTEKIMHNFELQRIIDTIPAGISIIRDGYYIRANEYLRNNIIKNHTTQSVIGFRIGSLTDKDSEFVNRITEFSNSKEQEIKFEAIIESNKQLRHHLVFAQNIFSNQSVETVITTIDIQDLKNREIENNINLAKLEHGSKMAALGEMSSGIAHEINNPLTIIAGRIQMIKKQSLAKVIDSTTLVHSLDVIEKTTFRIAKIIKGLKTFSRDAAHDDFVQSKMSELIDDTLSFCETRFKNNGVLLKYDNSSYSNHIIECQITQISQVLLNVLNNSFDAIANLPEKWIDLSVNIVGSNYIFKITDSGTGVPQHVRDKMMQPFFTTKQVGKGTGLGLSLSKNIIEAHHGRIYFNYEHPTNTQLIIELPIFQTKKIAA